MTLIDYGSLIGATLKAAQDNSDRSVQSAAGVMGPSDLGFCRQKATLMTRGVGQTDSQDKWSAAVGTAIHNYVEEILAEAFPDWILGSVHKRKVTATFPSGAVVSGTPDIIIPDAQVLLDIKTNDGLATVRREGSSQSHKYQRHTYVMGCIAAGIFDPSKPIYVGNIYFDRSGKETQPHCVIEEYDPTLTDQIDSWINDVIYAVKNGEDASRDVPAPVCERICPYFTACRGDMPITEGADFITDADLLAAVDQYNEGKDLAKMGEQLKKEASERLVGVNGTTGKWTVRWTQINPSRVEAFEKQGYMRLDIRRSR